MKKNTIEAIKKHIRKGESRFFVGKYYYEVGTNGIIRRRELEIGRTPTSDWERINEELGEI